MLRSDRLASIRAASIRGPFIRGARPRRQLILAGLELHRESRAEPLAVKEDDEHSLADLRRREGLGEIRADLSVGIDCERGKVRFRLRVYVNGADRHLYPGFALAALLDAD